MEDKKLQEQSEDKTSELADRQLEDAAGGIPLFSIKGPVPEPTPAPRPGVISKKLDELGKKSFF